MSKESPNKRRAIDPSIGKNTQFKVGNPGGPGRPKKTALSDAYRELLESKHPSDPRGRTWAEVIAESQAHQAARGKTPAASEIADRAEGKPAQSIEVTGMEDLAERIAKARKALGGDDATEGGT